MLGFLDFRSPATRKRDEARKKRELKARAKKAVPWDPKMKFQKELTLQADTYPVRSLFEVEPFEGHDVRKAKPKHLVLSPGGKWVYCEKVVPAATPLKTAYGRERGDVIFDKPVLIPALHAMQYYRGEEDGWDHNPWMSTTPMEILTLRCGTRFAKGHTVIAGLGLGHQLIECSHRKQVKKLTLVEISQGLIDWLMPAIKPHLGCEVDVVVGDARKLIPDMTADAALIDIFKGYGGNEFPHCPNIPKVWCWGSQYSRSSGYLW
jgi:hypothetical protein